MSLLLILLFAGRLLAVTPQDALKAASDALAAGDVDGARIILEQATAADPKNPGSWILLAQTYAKQQRTEAALDAARKAESFEPLSPRMLQALANFYAVVARDLPKAASLGTRYAQSSPEDGTAWRRLAAFCSQSNLPDCSIEAATKAAAKEDSAELQAILGSAYVQKKDWANAVEHLREAAKLNPYDEMARFRLAQAHLLQQDFRGAIDVLESARKTFDKSPQIELALGVAYYGQRRFTDAVTQFLRTIALAPDVPQPYLFLARILDHAGDRLPEIIERFAQLETRNPSNPVGYVLHAKALVAQLPPTGYPPEAQAAYSLVQKSLSIKEDQADAHYLAGVLLDRQREFDQAARHLERSVELNPSDAQAHFRLARVYDRLGRKEDAETQRALHQKLSEEAKAGADAAIDLSAPGAPAR